MFGTICKASRGKLSKFKAHFQTAEISLSDGNFLRFFVVGFGSFSAVYVCQ